MGPVYTGTGPGPTAPGPMAIHGSTSWASSGYMRGDMECSRGDRVRGDVPAPQHATNTHNETRLSFVHAGRGSGRGGREGVQANISVLSVAAAAGLRS
jgi:hypothetical protein